MRRGLLQVIGEENYLLDDYGGSAAAYSLRYLSSSFVGSDVIEVRRSSDNAEQGFTPTEITNGTLTTFIGAGDGFIKTWYDQSGNTRNAIQTTTTLQPKIVDAGVLITENSNPAIEFTSDYLATSTFTTDAQPITKILVTQQNLNNFGYIIDGSSSLRGLVGTDGTYIGRMFAGLILTATSEGANPFLSQSLIYSLFDFFNSKFYKNSSLLRSGDAGSNGLNKVTIGVSGSTLNTQFFDGTLQEIIVYPSDQDANRTDIETNINDYYTIY